MKKIITLAFVALFALTGNAQLKVQTEKLVRHNDTLYIRENGHDYKVDTQTITVKLKEGKTLEAKDGTVIRKSKLGYIDIAVPEGKRVEEYAKELDESGIFENVELNSYGELCTVTINDPYSSSLWHLDSTRVRQAWEYEMGKPTVKVAILDSGIDKDHPDIGFGNNSYKNIDETLGWDYMTNSTYSAPTYYHGTFVAGFVGAKTNNGVGIAGVAGGNGSPGTTMLSYRIGYGPSIDGSIVDDAIISAVDNGAKVINMSFHMSSNTAMNEAIEYAYSHGVNLVAASGNQYNSYINYPASHSMVIAVGATDNTNHRANFSNYGTGLDIVAPGKDVYSTALNNGYDTSSGTSFAAPQVSGTIALMLSSSSSLLQSEIKNILHSTAQKLTSYSFNTNGWNEEVGYGMLDVCQAIKCARMDIVGTELICDSAIYQISLPDNNYTVVWSITKNYYANSNNLFHTNYPQNNQCMIKRDNTIALNNDTLIACVYDNYGVLLKTIRKCISTRPTAMFNLDYEYSGQPVLMSAWVSENTTAAVPIGSIVKMGDPRFAGMIINPVGATLPYFEHRVDSVFFSPYSNFSLHCYSNVDCDAFTLSFMTVIPFDLTPLNFAITNGIGMLSITRNQVNSETDIEDVAKFQSITNTKTWQIDIYRYTNGKHIFSKVTEDEQLNISTSAWVPDVYIIRIVVDGQLFTQKIKI